MRTFTFGSELTRSPVATISSTSVAAPAWSMWLASSRALLTLRIIPTRYSSLPTLRPCFHVVPSILLAVNPSPKGMGNGKEQRTLHPLGPSHRQYFSIPESLLGGRRRVVDRALYRELNECVNWLNFLGGFTSSGYFDVNAAASSGWAFKNQRILHPLHLLKRPESLEVGEGALSKLLARFTIIWASPRYLRPPRVHLHRSENRVSLHPRQLSMRRVRRTSTET